MLTKDQIQSLFTFCEKHFVKYYDVQVELVDHLANAIEKEIYTNPLLTFEKSVEQVYRSFGLHGFEPLVNQKEEIAEKQIKSLFWKLFKGHFGWTKILFFLVLVASCFTVFSLAILALKWFLTVTIFLSFGAVLYTYFFEGFMSGTGRKFLLINYLRINSIIIILPSLLYIQGLTGEKSFLIYTPHQILIPAISILLSLNIIAIMVAWKTLNSIKRTLHQSYPEVFSIEKKV